MWIVGRKSDQSRVHFQNSQPVIKQVDLENWIVSTFGGVTADYSFFKVTNGDKNRIRKGHSYTDVWTSGMISWDITGVDFTPEDSKKHLHATTNEISGTIKNDGVDTFTFDLTLYKSNNTDIDVDFTGNLNVPVSTPHGKRLTEVAFTAGVASLNFKTVESGIWDFPTAEAKEEGLKIEKFLKVKVLEMGVLT